MDTNLTRFYFVKIRILCGFVKCDKNGASFDSKHWVHYIIFQEVKFLEIKFT